MAMMQSVSEIWHSRMPSKHFECPSVVGALEKLGIGGRCSEYGMVLQQQNPLIA